MSSPAPSPVPEETAYRTAFPEAEEFLQKVQDNVWTPKDVVFEGDDARRFAELMRREPGLGRATALALGWFAHADGRVGDNMCALTDHVRDGALKALLMWNAGMEAAVHAKVYADLVTKVLGTALDVGEMDGAIGAKVETVRAWLERARERPALSCFVQAMTEAACFQTSFLVVQRGRTAGAPPCIGDANVLIQRDEFDHVLTGALIFKCMRWRLEEGEAWAVAEELVAAEHAFVDALFALPVLGLTKDATKRYVQFIADFVLERFGFRKRYGSENPYPDMLETLLATRTNSFERRVAVYRAEGDGTADPAAFEAPPAPRFE